MTNNLVCVHNLFFFPLVIKDHNKSNWIRPNACQQPFFSDILHTTGGQGYFPWQEAAVLVGIMRCYCLCVMPFKNPIERMTAARTISDNVLKMEHCMLGVACGGVGGGGGSPAVWSVMSQIFVVSVQTVCHPPPYGTVNLRGTQLQSASAFHVNDIARWIPLTDATYLLLFSFTFLASLLFLCFHVLLGSAQHPINPATSGG